MEDPARGAHAEPESHDDAHTAFLLALSDRLRSLGDPVAIQSAATELLVEHIGATRCNYSEYDEERGVGRVVGGSTRGDATNVQGVYELAHFAEQVEALRTGAPLVVHDWAEARLGERAIAVLAARQVRSQISVPLVKDGKLVATLSVNDATPRRWTDREVALVVETAERTWAAVERARVEAALRASEEKYRSLFETMDGGYVLAELVRDEGGRPVDVRYLDLNRAFGTLVGISASAAVGRLRSEVLRQPLDDAFAGYVEAVERQQMIRFEHGAAQRWYDVRIHPRGGDRFAVLYDDVTARKRAEQTLRENDARNRYLLSLADRLGALTDADAIRDASIALLGEHLDASCCHFTELDVDRGIAWISAEHLRGPADLRSRKGSYRLDDFLPFVAALATGAPLVKSDWRDEPLDEAVAEHLSAFQDRAQITVPLVKGGKLVATLSVHDTKPRAWSEGDVALVADTAHRTWAAIERARAETALRASEQLARGLLEQAMASRAEAEAANGAKDEFLAVLGHELRTPLAAILLWARALRTGAVGAGDLARAIDAISQSAETQSRLIDDLLDLSRLTTGKLRLSPTSFDVTRVVEEAMETVRHAAIAKGIALTTEIDDGVGAAVLDGTRLKQVLWNLLTNAVKFTPAGGEVTVRARRSEGQLEIEVSDDGEGIAPEFFPHLFEKFRQADMGEARPHMGLGIGLSLSKQLVELHGGTIEAASEGRGRGATFRVRVPCDEASAPASATGAARAGPTERPSLAGLRLLLVEDDANTQSAMKWSLERAGARVTACTDALEALAILEGDLEPDVIVSDLGLPGMSGLELIARVVALYESRGRPPPPSCAVSAHAREVDRRGAIDAGFDAYLAKPITPERLVEVVADLRHVLASNGA